MQSLGENADVIDVSNSLPFDDQPVMNFFRISNQNLLPAENRAGLQCHITLSVVEQIKLQDSEYLSSFGRRNIEGLHPVRAKGEITDLKNTG